MSDDILANVSEEGTNLSGMEIDENTTVDDVLEKANKSGEDDTPEGSKPEQKTEEDKPSQKGDKDNESDNTSDEDKTPFHKHPRWIEKQQQLDSAMDEINSLKEELTSLRETTTEKANQQPTDMPNWFKLQFGDTPEAQSTWKEYDSYSKAQQQTFRDEIKAELKKEQQQQVDETKKWQKYNDNEIKKLRDAGEEFNENELRKVAAEYQPTDSDTGLISFSKSLAILKAQKAAKPESKEKKTETKKKLGSVNDDGGESTPKKNFSSNDIRNVSWSDIT